MENTLSNRGKFFAQYQDQKIAKSSIDHDYTSNVKGNSISIRDYLELKPLSSITDDDAKSLGYRCAEHFKTEANESFWKDELRNLGFAVEWNGLSVEDQINYGWVKLKTD